jgi:Arc/MetJ-type ribon-helix-helix transcriptional regulator
MTTPVPTRFTDDELALIDRLVETGVGDSRSAVIRRGVHVLADSVRRARIGESIARSYREVPQTPEDDELAMASALALTEAEPW